MKRKQLCLLSYGSHTCVCEDVALIALDINRQYEVGRLKGAIAQHKYLNENNFSKCNLKDTQIYIDIHR